MTASSNAASLSKTMAKPIYELQKVMHLTIGNHYKT
ncbi:hypothetical protein COLAER_00715 [Collinsella aerofaciens ATCC 25986]|uniref:Uncharacterized protein n=1 Tax=Collinsella aerofaciens (strain ATCC 25986 / DSM 3979 / JCM 10188 / KCTC 3647 / NCTC 11838 / VPI 1003) TaxID=411903 RepID=A4E8H6_COLAA|nr:hypothetical protein COLAER_00715 [Collinsella aerofaciens ATCC 25986]